MEELKTWFLLLGKYWLFLLSGGGIAAIFVYFVPLIERWRGWTMPNKWYFLIIFLGFILTASFMVWKDEHSQLISLQERFKSPEFGGELNLLSDGNLPLSSKNYAFIVVNGIITNPRGPSSSISNWEMTIEFPDGRNSKGQFLGTIPNDIKVPVSEFQSIRFLTAEYWPTTGKQAIPPGGQLPGWILSFFSKADINEAYEKKASLVLEFQDVISNKKHKLSMQFGKKGINLPRITE